MYSYVAKFLQKDLEGFFKYGMHLQFYKLPKVFPNQPEYYFWDLYKL